MNKKQYLEMRNKLIEEAQTLINEGKIEEAKNKRLEVENLDNEFKAISTEQANLNALNDNQKIDIENQNKKVRGETMGRTEEPQNKITYENVFAKFALGNTLTNDEIAVYNKFNPENAYTHTTTNTEIVIPETVVDGIIKKAEEFHPFFADAKKLNITGNVKLIKHTAIKAGDAKHYTEDQATEDEQNEFGSLELKGFELAKAVTVSWKLQAMAISDFIPFLQDELGERIGATAGKAVVKGNGTNEPKGVVTALKAYNSNSQIVTPTKELTYKDLTGAIAKIKSAHIKKAKIYANNSTVWNVLANLMDGNNRPLFVNDVTSGGVGRIFGMVVDPEDALEDGEILIGNAYDGYIINTNEALKLVTEQHAKQRTTDFVGYMVYDGGTIDEEAFAFIEKATGAGK